MFLKHSISIWLCVVQGRDLCFDRVWRWHRMYYYGHCISDVLAMDLIKSESEFHVISNDFIMELYLS